jgi:putative restriction endonuclease
MSNAYVGITDRDWFEFLRSREDLDEVNFWQPGGRTQFRALSVDEPFLFKLHSPLNYIVGGGFFTHSSLLPCSLAWEAFGEKNGADFLSKMRRQIRSVALITSPFPGTASIVSGDIRDIEDHCV